MMFQARNLFPSEAADEICKVLGLKPNALVEPMVGKGNYRIAGTEDRLEIRFKKARIVHGFYSERAEKARRQAVKAAEEKKKKEADILAYKKAICDRYGNAGQKSSGRKT